MSLRYIFYKSNGLQTNSHLFYRLTYPPFLNVIPDSLGTTVSSFLPLLMALNMLFNFLLRVLQFWPLFSLHFFLSFWTFWLSFPYYLLIDSLIFLLLVLLSLIGSFFLSLFLSYGFFSFIVLIFLLLVLSFYLPFFLLDILVSICLFSSFFLF